MNRDFSDGKLNEDWFTLLTNNTCITNRANRKSEEFGQLNTKRPDACMSLIENAAGVHALGFVEVKPKDTKDIGLVKLDLIRLGQFWKDVIDQNKIKSVMAVQAVGKLDKHLFVETQYAYILETQ